MNKIIIPIVIVVVIGLIIITSLNVGYGGDDSGNGPPGAEIDQDDTGNGPPGTELGPGDQSGGGPGSVVESGDEQGSQPPCTELGPGDSDGSEPPGAEISEKVEPKTTEIDCDSSYPDVCIASSPPDLDCGEIPYSNFKVLQPDQHGFDRNQDGIGCEK